MVKRSKREILIRQAKAATILRKREARNDFWAYCLYHDPKFFAKRLFLKKVADAFTRVYESYLSGVIRRLAVSMPPRAGKSYIILVHFVDAWPFPGRVGHAQLLFRYIV